MSGVPLQAFNRFMLTTPSRFLTEPTSIIPLMQRNTYLLNRHITGKNSDEYLQASADMRDLVLGTLKTVPQFYNPNAPLVPGIQDILDQWRVPWRFVAAPESWTDHTVELNVATARDMRGAMKNLKRAIDQEVMISILHMIEDGLWSQPDTTRMESALAANPLPYSIPATNNGFPNGLFPAYSPGGAWTTSQQINPVTQVPLWRPTVESYLSWGAVVQVQAGESPHLFYALDRACARTQFDKIPLMPEFSDKATMPTYIACSLTGRANASYSMLASQDTFALAGKQDPAYPDPQFRGIPFVWAPPLDTAALYPGTGGTVLAPEDTADAAGPRYYGVNTLMMLLGWYKSRMFYRKNVPSSNTQPFTNTIWIDNWYNLINRAPNRHFHVQPSATVIQTVQV
ncbi:MAG: hypothetical protein ACSLFI_07705 [Solirubrobacterales bacterium]